MINNLVKEVSNNPGTGTTVQLAGAPSGFMSFVAGFGSGAKAFYFLTDGVQTEAQVGTVTAGAPNTLSRGTPLWTSTGSAARLNFTGAVTVYSALPAQRQPYFDDTNSLQMLSRRIVALGSGAEPQDAAALSQLAFRALGQADIAAPTALAIFTLPANSVATRYRFDFRDLVPSANGALYCRFSIDGGATYRQGASDYGYSAARIGAATLTPIGASQGFAPLSDTILAANPVSGFMEFQQNVGMGIADTAGIIAGPNLARWAGCWNLGFAGPLTNVCFGFVGTNIATGTIRMTGG